MKINPVLLIIAIAIAGLGAFGFFQANTDSPNNLLITIGGGVSILLTLGGLLALSSPNGGTANIKVMSALFFVVLLVEHIIFSVAGVPLTPYVIITGVLLLLYVLICYAVIRALK